MIDVNPDVARAKELIDELAGVVNRMAADAPADRRQSMVNAVYELVNELNVMAKHPIEPTDTNLVRFSKWWGSRAKYDYVAMRAPNTWYWYVTGTTGQRTWEQLLKFITQHENDAKRCLRSLHYVKETA